MATAASSRKLQSGLLYRPGLDATSAWNKYNNEVFSLLNEAGEAASSSIGSIWCRTHVHVAGKVEPGQALFSPVPFSCVLWAIDVHPIVVDSLFVVHKAPMGD